VKEVNYMADNLISIIVPVYNAAYTLKECLSAIYASCYPNLEVIVVDDCSTDHSLKVVQEFPCKIIKLPENSGAAVARNEGAKLAQSEILFFIDADIIINPDSLSLIKEDFKRGNISGVVGLLSPQLRYKNFASQYKNLWMHYTYKILPDFIGVSYTSITAFKKDVFLKLGGFDKRYKEANVEDTEFGQRLLTQGYKVYSNKKLEAEHIKHYNLKQVLKLDFKRSYELTIMFIRNFFKKERQKNYTSVPFSFILSLFLIYFGLLLLVLSQALSSFYLLIGGLLALIVAVFSNINYLLFLKKVNGPLFMLKSALFICLDSFVSGLGVISAFLAYLLGKRY